MACTPANPFSFRYPLHACDNSREGGDGTEEDGGGVEEDGEGKVGEGVEGDGVEGDGVEGDGGGVEEDG